MRRLLDRSRTAVACAAIASTLATVASATADRTPGQLALPFTANEGDQPPVVAFTARSKLGTTFVTREAALVHVLAKPAVTESPRGWSVAERFVGGSTFRVRGDAPLALQGSRLDRDGQLVDLHGFSRVILPGLYRRIDVELAHTKAGIERTYRIAPGGNPRRIRIAFDGATGLRMNTDGRLLVETPLGALAQSRPVAWQEGRGGRVEVAVRYRLSGRAYGFDVAAYDRSKPLYIDPILATTYLGGSGDESATDVAIHPATGDVYVTGRTASAVFPGIAGGATDVVTGSVFVARFDRDLRTLKHATLLPGWAYADSHIAIHPSTGDVYLWSLGDRTFAPLPATCTATPVFYIVRLAADLRTLLAGWCRGSGSMSDYRVSGLAVGLNGDLYASGAAFWYGGGDPRPGMPNFIFIAYPFLGRFAADLAPRYTTGGGGGPIAVDPTSGDVYALGIPDPYRNTQAIERYSQALALLGTLATPQTYAAIAVHPTTRDVYLGGTSSQGAAVVSRIDGALAGPVQSATYGGTNGAAATAVGVDPASGDVFIGGGTLSVDLPGTSSGAQPASGGGTDGFIARFSRSFDTIRRATYFGGSGHESIGVFTFDTASGDLVAVSRTTSPDLPGTGGSAQPALRGPSDAFVTRISTSLSGGVSLLAAGGGGQHAKSNQAFGAPLTARLRDGDGALVSGMAVTFTLPSTGPRAAFPGGASAAVVISGADGTATSPVLTAAREPGAFVATASAGTVSAAFDLAVDPATEMFVVGGDRQHAKSGDHFAAPLSVRLIDTADVPVAGVAVKFTLPATGPRATFAGGASIAVVISDASGAATSPAMTAGLEAGAFVATAIAGAVSATFELVVDRVTSMLALGGDGQRAKPGERFAAPLSVRLVDATHAPVAGVPVTFSLPSTGPRATFAGGASTAVVVSDASGAATSPALTAAREPGAFVASASAGEASLAFALAVDPADVAVVPADHPLALLLGVAVIIATAWRRVQFVRRSRNATVAGVGAVGEGPEAGPFGPHLR